MVTYPWDLQMRRSSDFPGSLDSLAAARVGTKYHYVKSKNMWIVLDAFRWGDRLVVDASYRPTGDLGRLLDFTEKEWNDLQHDGLSAFSAWRHRRGAPSYAAEWWPGPGPAPTPEIRKRRSTSGEYS